MKSYDLIIVGAGPSGMSAAIAAAEAGNRILLLESSDKLGKKILVTGNGRCNLTNELQNQDCYRSECPEKAFGILKKFTFHDTMEFFKKIGILTKSKNGYIYPYNEQAAAVREAFSVFLNYRKNVDCITSCRVDQIDTSKSGYVVRSNNGKFYSTSVLLTTGGLAGPKIGCDGSGYKMARHFGHSIIQPLPALTPLKSSAPFLKKISGVRNQAEITLMIDAEPFHQEKGELQWTDYGISGVAIFQLSRYAILALEEGKKVSLRLDFMPEWDAKQLQNLLSSFVHLCDYKNMAELMSGILPVKLSPIVLREAGIESSQSVESLNENDIMRLCKAIKTFSLRISGYVGYDKAQVTRGGISLKEVTDGLESVYQEGLFFAGEILDVDGTCGGYNLQWAFSSGQIAGKSAVSYLKKKGKGENDQNLRIKIKNTP